MVVKHGYMQRTCMLNLLQDIQSRLDKLPQNVSNLPILILRHTGCNDSIPCEMCLKTALCRNHGFYCN